MTFNGIYWYDSEFPKKFARRTRSEMTAMLGWRVAGRRSVCLGPPMEQDPELAKRTTQLRKTMAGCAKRSEELCVVAGGCARD